MPDTVNLYMKVPARKLAPCVYVSVLKDIKSILIRKQTFICFALEELRTTYGYLTPCHLAVGRLLGFINKAMGGDSISLERWLIEVHKINAYKDASDEQRHAYRIRWVNFLIKQYQQDERIIRYAKKQKAA